ncbi:hypothetical protein NCS57_00781800 [Fusarium keratoplasticum]|uniref:Uncharacterized protein n=1 Tax=Fusarium keratoplasticum TaxID=1328300 RepID=A0ACC0R0U9_9HYPO|nr:hypothetical protein NCS57_00781800 [Fusarium keratoplasticum]KAI8669661.1 hypothetical protein NCS57_00781800 [Fusarium keratoplasticum]KAI8674252.1 hypothetical protein NCS55_00748300 [Fusarium keratoplasticum]
MASFQTFRLVPMREEVLGEKDEWAGLSDAKERRKRQNRINKRAARRRQRLTEAHEHEAHFEPPPHTSVSHQSGKDQINASSATDVYFPITPDSRLLHVISFNVSRAILTNYFILSTIPLETTRFCSICRVFALPVLETGVEITLPVSLMPTHLQEQVPHPGWVDLFPSPKLRDNLILALQEYDIDEDAFMLDLVGEAFESLCLTSDEVEEQPAVVDPKGSNGERQPAPVAITTGEGDTITAANLASSWIGESGIISWSDPWEISGWEVTESFARKWGFLLIGCEDVVNAANKWRETRGENPLSVKI